MGTLRGEQIIAQSFKREGVDTIFFMMGGPTGGTAGACIDLGMKGIYVRHEQAAAMMAHAYARVDWIEAATNSTECQPIGADESKWPRRLFKP